MHSLSILYFAFQLFILFFKVYIDIHMFVFWSLTPTLRSRRDRISHYYFLSILYWLKTFPPSRGNTPPSNDVARHLPTQSRDIWRTSYFYPYSYPTTLRAISFFSPNKLLHSHVDIVVHFFSEAFIDSKLSRSPCSRTSPVTIWLTSPPSLSLASTSMPPLASIAYCYIFSLTHTISH